MKSFKYIYVFIAIAMLVFISGCNETTIDFIDYDGSLIETIKTNDLDNLITPKVIRKGYTFSNWEKSVENGKHVYKAKYSPNKYLISFDQLPDNVSVMYDSEVSTLPTIEKKGYNFIGWKYNNEMINTPFVYQYDSNIMLESVWKIKVDYKNYDGTLIKSVEVPYLDDATCEEPTRLGYAFARWEKRELQNSIEFIAKFIPNKYNIYFDSDGANIDEIIQIDYNSEIPSFSTPLKENHTFIGWFNGTEEVSFPFRFKYTTDITLKAKWKVNDKTKVEYVDFDGKLITSFEAYNPDTPIDTIPTRDGYKFDKWEKSVLVDKVQFKAIYKPNTYYINFDTDNGNLLEKKVVEFESSLSNLPVPTKENYDFLGWMYNDVLISYPLSYDFKSDITLKAKWKIKDIIYVEYIDYDDSVIKNMEVYYIEKAFCNDPVRTGYSFVKWEKQNIDSKIVYKATYKANIYKFTFVSNSLNGISSINTPFDTTFTGLPTPSKDNYIFMGWYLDNQKIELPFIYNIDKDVNVYGRWEKSNYSSVSYEEYNQHYLKVSQWFENLNQIQISTDTKTKIKSILSGIELEIIDNQKLYTKLDRINGYLEYKYSGTGIEPYYEIYRTVEDVIYFDELLSNEGKYVLYSNIHYGEIPYSDNGIVFGSVLNQQNSFRKIADDHYLAYTTLGALYDEEIDIDVDELAKRLGISKEILMEIGIEIETLFNEETNQFAINIELKEFSFKKDNIQYSLDLVLNSIYNNYNQEIIPFDYDQDNIYLPKAKSFEEATEITDISEPIISYEVLGPHYYKVYLEAGQYSCNVDNVTIDEITIYDNYKKEFDLGPLWNHFLAYKYQFVIKDSNYYYIKVDNSYSDTYSISFTKLGYETISDYNDPLTFSDTNTVIFEGEYDFMYYHIDSDSNGILIIEKLDNNIAVLYKGISGEYKKDVSSRGNKIIVPIYAGNNSIVINSYEKNTVNFKVEIIKDNPDTTKDVANMPVITDQFSEEYYVVGFGCKNDYLKFEVSKSGYYKIEFEHYVTILDPDLKFYTSDSKEPFTSQNRVFLNQGRQYYIEISLPPYYYAIVKVRVTMTT